jgi:hypothetical protein
MRVAERAARACKPFRRRVKQDAVGIHVYDRWITGAGKAVGPRTIARNGSGVSDGFHVVER